MRKWIRYLLLSLAVLAESLPAQGPHLVPDSQSTGKTNPSAMAREANYGEWAEKELTPWFQNQADRYLTSKVPSSRTVVLRYKTFIQDKPRGHIVIIHGYGERIEKHMEMAFDFYQAGFNVFALDQRGFGRSTRLNPEGKDSIYVDRFDDYVLDLEQFILEVVRSHEPRPTILFAHSMGGLVSTLFLSHRPDLVDAAILSAPMLSIDLKGVPRSMALLLSLTADTFGYGSSYAFGQIGPRKPEFTEKSGTGSHPRWQYYANFYSRPEEWHLSLGGASFHWLGEAVRKFILIDDEAWARQIKTPVLLFQADRDSYVTPDGQNAFCAWAQRCRKIFVPGTRHEIYREQDAPRAFYMNSILQFLDEQTGPGQNPSTPR